MWLGIDFGTCFSCAAYVADNGELMLVRDTDNPGNYANSIPSTAYISKEGEILVGHAANEKMRLHPTRYFSEIKRDLGGGFPLYYDDGEVMPETLVTTIIHRLKQMAETASGAIFEAAIVTIPATYQKNKKELVRSAVLAAGFQHVELLEEPVAAAIYSISRGKQAASDVETILLYDLGGGTFDAALVQKDPYGYRFLSEPVGNPRCGGLDFDEKLYHHFIAQCSPEFRQDLANPDLQSERAARRIRNTKRTIQDYCCQFKHRLSQMEEWNSLAPDAVLDEIEEFSITRDEFESMISPLIEDTLGKCDQLLKESNVKKSDISRIVMAGGSSRIPYVQARLEAYFNRPVSISRDPELAICQGAAIYGHMRNRMMDAPIVDVNGYYGTYKTISHALAEAKQGTTIQIRPGRYQECVSIINKDIHLEAIEGGRNTVIGGDLDCAIYVDGGKVSIRGLLVQVSRPSRGNVPSAAIVMKNGELYLTGMEVVNSGGNGIHVLVGCEQGITVDSCHIHSCSVGVIVEGNHNPSLCKITLKDTKVTNCNRIGVSIKDCLFSAERITVAETNESNDSDCVSGIGLICLGNVSGTAKKVAISDNMKYGVAVYSGNFSLHQAVVEGNIEAGLFVDEAGKLIVQDTMVPRNNVGIISNGSLDCKHSKIVENGEAGLFSRLKSVNVIKNSDISGNAINIAAMDHSRIQCSETSVADAKDGGITLFGSVVASFTSVKVTGNSKFGIRTAGCAEVKLGGSQITANTQGVLMLEKASLRATNTSFANNSELALWAEAKGKLVIDECGFANPDNNIVIVEGAKPTMTNSIVSAGEYGVVFKQSATGSVKGGRIEGCKLGLVLEEKATGSVEEVLFKANVCAVLSEEGRGTLAGCQIEASRLAGIESRNGCTTVFEKCIVQGSEGTGLFLHDSARSTFKNCVIKQSGKDNIVIKSKANPQFVSCVITEGQEGGILVLEGGNGKFSRCTVSGNGKKDKTAEIVVLSSANPIFEDAALSAINKNAAIVINAGQGKFLSCKINGNSDAQAVYIAETSKSCPPLFQKCTITQGYNGVYLAQGGGIKMDDCTITSNSNDGIHLKEGVEAAQFTNCRIQGNKGDGVYAEGAGSARFSACVVSGHSGFFSKDWKYDAKKFKMTVS